MRTKFGFTSRLSKAQAASSHPSLVSLAICFAHSLPHGYQAVGCTSQASEASPCDKPHRFYPALKTKIASLRSILMFFSGLAKPNLRTNSKD